MRKFESFGIYPGNNLMKVIRAKCAELHVDKVDITKVKYEQSAVMDMYEGNDCVARDYLIEI